MECPHIPVTGYGDFSKRLHDKVAGRRVPITGSIEVTARCNLKCVHCYINLPAGDRAAQDRELNTRAFFDIIDQIVDEGCLWLLLTGGEPFLRPDFIDIYTYAKKKGLIITIFTNGTLITPEIADYLADWAPFAVEITLYGSTRETYEKVTGLPGSYDKCMQGIDLLVERDIPLKLKTMVLTLNAHELDDMRAYAEGLGINFYFDPVLNVRLDGVRDPASFRISPEEVVALDLDDEKRMKKWHDFCDGFMGPPKYPDDLFNCGAGVKTFHIDPSGQISVCMMSRGDTYDLRQGTFKQAWHEFIAEIRAQKRSKETDCQACHLISLCGQCPGWALMENGDPEDKIAYLCEIAQMRAEAFGLNYLNKEEHYGKENELR